MIDELNKLPSGEVDSATLQKILSDIHENAIGFDYVTSVPTKMEYGKVAIYRSGSDYKIYYKLDNGTITYVSGPYVAPTTLIVPNTTSDPSSPVAGEIWFRTDSV